MCSKISFSLCTFASARCCTGNLIQVNRGGGIIAGGGGGGAAGLWAGGGALAGPWRDSGSVGGRGLLGPWGVLPIRGLRRDRGGG